jgi:hypothetical protein
MRLSPLSMPASSGVVVPTRIMMMMMMVMMIDERRTVGRMRTGRGNRSTRKKPAPVALFPPEVTHDLKWNRTQVASVGSQRLPA